MMKLFTLPTSLKFAGSLVAAFGGAVGFALAIEGSAVAYDQYHGNSRNERCEAQLVPIAKKLNLPLNGESRYNPWLRQCSYAYAKLNAENAEKPYDVIIHKWFPELNFISK